MPGTASPAVSVIVPLIARAELHERAGLQLRAQTLSDIEIVLVGGTPGLTEIASLRADERVRREAPGLSLCDALNAGLESVRGERVMLFDPRDELFPCALEALAVRMRHGGESGAFGRFRFRAPIGDLPQDPLKDAPDEVGFDELTRQQWFPLSAMMVDAGAVGGIHFKSSLANTDSIHPAEYDWLLRLSEVGVRWSRSRVDVARAWVRTLAPNDSINASLTQRAMITHRSLRAHGADEAVIRIRTQSTVDAHQGLLSDAEAPPSLYCDASSRSTAEMARWWQRFGYVGEAPEHLNSCGMAEQKSVPADAKRLLRALDPARAVVVVGLGQAAPILTGLLASLGATPRLCGVSGELPGWVTDAQAVHLASGADAPPGSQFVLTESDVSVHFPAGASIASALDVPADFQTRAVLMDDGAMPPPPELRGLFRLPSLIREAIVQQLDPARPIALLGLGRNARLLARTLASQGRTILGVDSGVQGSPWWSEVDHVRIQMIASPPELPRDAQLVMTVLKDDRFLGAVKILLPDANVLRWCRMADVLAGVHASAWSEHSDAELQLTREAA
ncbi:MAG: hypothetical protein ACREJD_01990 [Phycisphaerales bacterium]